MPLPTRNVLGTSTLNRKWLVDVDTSATATPTWTPVMGVMEFQETRDSTLQDDSDFDSAGQMSQTKTAEQWKLEMKIARKVLTSSATAYDPGQEKLRALSIVMGPGNTAHVRWYEVTASGPLVESYEGRASVEWAPDGGGMDGLSTVQVTLTGQGQRLTPVNPGP